MSLVSSLGLLTVSLSNSSAFMPSTPATILVM